MVFERIKELEMDVVMEMTEDGDGIGVWSSLMGFCDSRNIKAVVCYSLLDVCYKPLKLAAHMNSLYAEGINVYMVMGNGESISSVGWLFDENGRPTEFCRMMYAACMYYDKIDRSLKREALLEKYPDIVREIDGYDPLIDGDFNALKIASRYGVSVPTVKKVLKILSGDVYDL